MIDSTKVATILNITPRRVRALAESHGDLLGAEKIGTTWAFDEAKVKEFAKLDRPAGGYRPYKETTNQQEEAEIPEALRNI
jgi:hypothetical protein